MKRFALPAALALATAMSFPAAAQQISPLPVVEAGHSVLTVTGEGRSLRTPDLAVFNAGVTTQGKTAAEALGENSRAMAQVINSLKRAGIAERDIQTSNLSINPIYAEPRRLPDGSMEQRAPVIVGYQASNNVSVRQRRLGDFGKVIDTLVSSGANQVNGPSFQLDDSDTALDEARTSAMAKARARAELYARAAGLRVVRILSITEGGGYYAPPPVFYARADSGPAAPPPPPAPVQPGELQLTANVTVLFELAP